LQFYVHQRATWFEARTVKQSCKANQVGDATTKSAEALANLCYRILIEDWVAALEAVKATLHPHWNA
jgi:glycerol dehydrogenase